MDYQNFTNDVDHTNDTNELDDYQNFTNDVDHTNDTNDTNEQKKKQKKPKKVRPLANIIRSKQNQSVKDFWRKQKEVIKQERSAKAVYTMYKNYLISISADFPPLNEYIFRTDIRKLGYSNSAKISDPIMEKIEIIQHDNND
jgi:hypothetical protein